MLPQCPTNQTKQPFLWHQKSKAVLCDHVKRTSMIRIQKWSRTTIWIVQILLKSWFSANYRDIYKCREFRSWFSTQVIALLSNVWCLSKSDQVRFTTISGLNETINKIRGHEFEAGWAKIRSPDLSFQNACRNRTTLPCAKTAFPMHFGTKNHPSFEVAWSGIAREYFFFQTSD